MDNSLSTRIKEAQNASTMRSLVIYARMLGITWGVDIVFDSTTVTASTDGREIRICPLDIGTEEDAALLEGLIDHEAGVHCRFTDFDGSNALLLRQPEVIDSLSNVFEDVWGERELYKVMPGCSPKITRALEILSSRGIFSGPKEATHPAKTMINMLLCGLRAVKLGQTCLVDFYLEHRQLLEQQVGPELVDQIWSTAQKVDSTFDSVTAVELSIEVYALIKEAQNKAEEQAQHQDSSSQGQPSQSSSGQRDSNNPQSGQGQPSQGQSSQGQAGQASPSQSSSSSNQGQTPPQGGSRSTPSNGSTASPPSQSGSKPQPTSAAQQESSPGDTSGPQSGQQQLPSSSQPTHCDSKSDAQTASATPHQPPQAKDSTTQQSPTQQSSVSAILEPDANGTGSQTASPQSQLGRPSCKKPHSRLTAEQITNIRKVLDATKQDAGSGELADSLVAGMSDKAAPHGQPSSGSGCNWDLQPSSPVQNPMVDHAVGLVARPVAVRLGSKLDQVLSVQTTCTSELSVRGRKLSSRMIPRLMSASTMRVFKRTDEAEQLEVAVSILQDISSSMTSKLDDDVSCITAVGASTRALGDTLERFDIPFSVHQFGEKLTTIKRFDDRWRRSRSLHYSALEGSTSTHKALNAVVPELAARSEERRLLVLETDGIPSDVDRTVAALCEAKALGVNVAVFLVGSSQAVKLNRLARFTTKLASHGIPHAAATTTSDIARVVFEAVSAATSKR